MEDPLLTPIATPIQRRLVIWGPDGAPLVTTAPLVTKAQVADLYAAAAAQPFRCEDPLHPDFIFNGLSCVEVMVKKQVQRAAETGDAEVVIDRLIGRPKQSTENTRVVLTYEDFLKETARQEAIKGPAAPLDAEFME